ncbi:hypothetical protein D3C73_1217830 [compost metagenome]
MIRLYQGSAVSGSSSPSGASNGISSSSIATSEAGDGLGEPPLSMLPEAGDGVALLLPSPPPSGTGSSVTVTSPVSGVALAAVGVAEGVADGTGVWTVPGFGVGPEVTDGVLLGLSEGPGDAVADGAGLVPLEGSGEVLAEGSGLGSLVGSGAADAEKVKATLTTFPWNSLPASAGKTTSMRMPSSPPPGREPAATRPSASLITPE